MGVRERAPRFFAPDDPTQVARILPLAFSYNFGAGANDVLTRPVLSCPAQSRIEILSYTLTQVYDFNSDCSWLCETTEDFAVAITLQNPPPHPKTPEEIVANDPTDPEAAKFVRTLGKFAPYLRGVQEIMLSQSGLLTPGNGIGFMAQGRSNPSFWGGILTYRILASP